ncbi:MAG: hypothetical protein LLG06_04090 [Desulfobacteraceae bacterium]|nr:hypothetical protein [Desulfobacteraceae bacterium]
MEEQPTAVQKFSLNEIKIREFEECTEAAVAELGKKYLALKVDGLNDKEGLEAVHKARMDMVRRRTAIAKAGKAGREEATRFSKKVKALEDKIIGWMAPIEQHLVDQEQFVENERRRIAEEAANKERMRIQARRDKLFGYGATFNGCNYLVAGISVPESFVPEMSDEQFDKICGDIEIAVEAERLRKEEEARLAAIEQERLDRERGELQAEKDRLEAIAREQEETRRKLDAENKRLEAEKASLQTPESAPPAEAKPEPQTSSFAPPPPPEKTFQTASRFVPPPPPSPVRNISVYEFPVTIKAVARVVSTSREEARTLLLSISAGSNLYEFSDRVLDLTVCSVEDIPARQEAA